MSNEKYAVDYALLLTQLVDEIKGWTHSENKSFGRITHSCRNQISIGFSQNKFKKMG
jgi:hypothetical protein